MKPDFYIVDGNSFAYRAFYGIRPLTGPGGFEVHAVYGFFNMIKRILKDRQPAYFAIAFDSSGPTKRHEKYEAYKEQREKMPDSLRQQLKMIKDILHKGAITQLEERGLEADDIIASACHAAKAEGMKSVIVSGDKDLLQLIDKDISMLKISQGGEKLLGPKEVKEEYGIEPKQMIDVLSLMGDASDNIPGVAGIGEKTAYKLVNDYGSVENIIKKLDVLEPEKLRKKLKDGMEDLKISHELVILAPDLEWVKKTGFRPEKCGTDTIDRAALNEDFAYYNFKSLIDDTALVKKAEPVKSAPEKTKKKAKTIAASQKLFFCGEPGELAIMSDESIIYFRNDRLDLSKLDDKKPLITNSSKELYKRVPGYSGEIWDISLMSYLLEPDRNYPDFSYIFSEYLGGTFASFEDIAGKGAKKIMIELVDRKQLDSFAAYILERSDELAKVLHEKLHDEELLDIYEKMELPTARVLSKMEITGLKIDAKYLKELDEKTGREIAKSEKKVYEITGGQFNINSPKQLGAVLFEKLKLPVQKKTKTGYSTDAEVLSNLEGMHEIIPEILRYRTLTKLKTGFLEAITGYMDKNGMIHPLYNQDVAATGRLSSSNPNIQNIPARGDEGREIRKIFVPLPGHELILKADYSQIELRILAHVSKDKRLIEAFKKEEDIHTITGCEIFGVTPEKLTHDQRRFAKTVNFGIVYGISPYGLAKQLKVGNKEAAGYIDRFFKTFPDVLKYQEETVIEARKNGYVTTIFGRKRKFIDINSQNRTVREFAERGAINAPIQGSAADIMKKAMLEVDRLMTKQAMGSVMLVQVHDELVFSVKKGETEKVRKAAIEGMQGAADLSVPLTVNTGTGENWHDCE